MKQTGLHTMKWENNDLRYFMPSYQLKKRYGVSDLLQDSVDVAKTDKLAFTQKTQASQSNRYNRPNRTPIKSQRDKSNIKPKKLDSNSDFFGNSTVNIDHYSSAEDFDKFNMTGSQVIGGKDNLNSFKIHCSTTFASEFKDRNKEYLTNKKKKLRRLKKEAYKDCTFKPKINKNSKKIDQKRFDYKKQTTRQDELYKLSYHLKERKEELKEMIEMERFERYGEKEMKECTFKPKLNSYKGKSNMGNLDIAKRNEIWKRKKEQRIQEIQEARKDIDLEGCTFVPRINQYKSTIYHN